MSQHLSTCLSDELSSLIDNGLKSLQCMSSRQKEYLIKLRKLRTNQVVPNKKDFLSYLKITLIVEELKHRKDLDQYNLYHQQIIRINTCSFKIYVEGLEEERPSITINDYVELIDVLSRESYKMKVNFVFADYISVKADKRFCDQFRADKEYDIKFCLNEYPFKCAHLALCNIELYELTRLLFLNKKPGRPKEFYGNLLWFNEKIANNEEQKQAVFNIIDKTVSDLPYILYGPPGTGKTATLVEAICQAWRMKDTKRIVVCTPSNTSADVITKLLMKYLNKSHLLRVYSRSIEVSTIDKDILDCCNINELGEIYLNFRAHNLPKIVITTLCTCRRLYNIPGLEPTDFSYIFIDEAGQATEPDSMIPFSLLSNRKYAGKLCGKIILAGDPKQLGPVILSEIAKPLLGKSMIERMMTTLRPYQLENGRYNSRYITKLIQNYRCHPAIIHLPNELFYEGQLIPCYSANVRKGENWKGLPNPKFPIIFHEVMGDELKDNRSPSAYNKDELKIVLRYIRRLLRSKLGDMTVKAEDIGIVTPFTAQKLKLQTMLKEEQISDIEVGTVQLFQAKEKEIIIFTTVRSRIFAGNNGPHIGFLSDPRRFNVALTRAKSLLIIIGHPKALSVDDKWRTLQQYCRDNNSYLNKYYKCESAQNLIARESEQSNKPLLNDASRLVLQTDTSTQLNVNPRLNITGEKNDEQNNILIEQIDFNNLSNSIIDRSDILDLGNWIEYCVLL